MVLSTVLFVLAFAGSAGIGWWSKTTAVALAVLAVAAGLALLGCPLGWYRSDADAQPCGDAIIYFGFLGLPAGVCAWAGASLQRQRES